MAQSTLTGFTQKRKVRASQLSYIFLPFSVLTHIPVDVAQREAEDGDGAVSDYVPSASDKKEATGTSSAPVAKKPRAKPGTGSKAGKAKANASVGTCSLTKKEFGDEIKDALRLEKYEVQRMCIPVCNA